MVLCIRTVWENFPRSNRPNSWILCNAHPTPASRTNSSSFSSSNSFHHTLVPWLRPSIAKLHLNKIVSSKVVFFLAHASAFGRSGALGFWVELIERVIGYTSNNNGLSKYDQGKSRSWNSYFFGFSGMNPWHLSRNPKEQDRVAAPKRSPQRSWTSTRSPS